MSELEILREYQNCGAVVTIQRILNDEEKRKQLDEAKENWLVGKLIQFSRSAMHKAGIEPNENGQYEFADFVFFDMSMPDADKIYWLEMVEGDSQKSRIEALKAK
jgi:hypothetical protein